MDATEGAGRNARELARRRFASEIAGAPGDTRLDVAAFCIAAHAHPGLDIDAWCVRLDTLAAECAVSTFDGVRTHLFEAAGYEGNRADYADPENSFLDSVISRRTGIPITLSVLMMEVGRRLGVDVRGVGMPGHFLVQDGDAEDGRWCDPFHGGAVYDLAACRLLFARLHGSAQGFHEGFLRPATTHEILARMLTNLEHGRLAGDPLALRWMCELHRSLPDLPEQERARLARASAAVDAHWN